jgi:hypothetical protein
MSSLDRLIAPWAEIIPYPIQQPPPGQTALLEVPLLTYLDHNKVRRSLLPLGPNLALTTTWTLADIEHLPHGVSRTLLLPPTDVSPNLRVIWASDGWRHIAPSPYLEVSEDVVLFDHSEMRIAVIPGRVGNVLRAPESFYPEKYNFTTSHQSVALVYTEAPYQAQLRIGDQGTWPAAGEPPYPNPSPSQTFWINSPYG